MHPGSIGSRRRTVDAADLHPHPSRTASRDGTSTNVVPLPAGWQEQHVTTESGPQIQYLHTRSRLVYGQRPGPLPSGWEEIVIKEQDKERVPPGANDKRLLYRHRNTGHRQMGRPLSDLPRDWEEGWVEGPEGNSVYGLLNSKTGKILYERPSSEEEFSLHGPNHGELVKAAESRSRAIAGKIENSNMPEMDVIALTHLQELEHYIGLFEASPPGPAASSETLAIGTEPAWPVGGMDREMWLGEEIAAYQPDEDKTYSRKITGTPGIITGFRAHENDALMAAAAQYVYGHSVDRRHLSVERNLASELRQPTSARLVQKREIACLQRYIAAVCKRAQLSGLSLLQALNLFEKSQNATSARDLPSSSSMTNMAKTFIGGLMIGQKINSEDAYSNASWTEVHQCGVEAVRGFLHGGDASHPPQPMIGALSLADFNRMERESLGRMGFSGDSRVLDPDEVSLEEYEQAGIESAGNPEGPGQWAPHALSVSKTGELKAIVGSFRASINNAELNEAMEEAGRTLHEPRTREVHGWQKGFGGGMADTFRPDRISMRGSTLSELQAIVVDATLPQTRRNEASKEIDKRIAIYNAREEMILSRL